MGTGTKDDDKFYRLVLAIGGGGYSAAPNGGRDGQYYVVLVFFGVHPTIYYCVLRKAVFDGRAAASLLDAGTLEEHRYNTRNAGKDTKGFRVCFV